MLGVVTNPSFAFETACLSVTQTSLLLLPVSSRRLHDVPPLEPYFATEECKVYPALEYKTNLTTYKTMVRYIRQIHASRLKNWVLPVFDLPDTGTSRDSDGADCI